MDMRLLSVIIPAYNTELYLARCLDSLLYDESVFEHLEVIIVNDGSSDDTFSIAQTYSKKYPDVIKIINKKNGGHGSTVNAGLREAHGKYLKVVDSDDWVNVFDFGAFVRQLKDLEDDILVTNYKRDVLYDSSSIDFCFYDGNDKAQKISRIADLIGDEDFFFMFSMHSMTIKTASLQKVWGDGLFEKTFYVDQQFVAKALMCANTFRVLNFDIYRYFIGRPDQSVSLVGFFKHRQDHEKVLRWLLEVTHSEVVLEKPYLAKVLHRQTELMIKTHYEIYYTNLLASKSEIAELLLFDKYLETNFADLHKSIPAAAKVKRRLSSVRRIVKRKLLS